MVKFKVDFKSIDNTFDVDFSSQSAFAVEYGKIQEVESRDIPVYDGQTTVTPSVNDQTVLETANKKLLDNVTVLELPQYRTSNTAGGTTVYLGRRVD